ncbi:nucleotide sugar dehydrogenase [Halosolutus gelatinilyticus]|uniref:nucleotide sugar dehydrogenase n=1 Tax=Halosolutus gelatinilyticus TaxID=2931975 RepID=UPI001FF3F720|nr:nucleotide sugar dehydrogenase [Halosolutus gelatinilyticus]
MTDTTTRTRVGALYGTAVDESVQRRSFTNGNVPVAVYGLGKMGLPLAAVFADVGGNVVGVDVDPNVVETVENGGCPVDREPGLRQLVRDLVSTGALRATADPRRAAREASIHVVIVPTPITSDDEPDLAMLDTAIADIATGLDEGDLVLLECTVPPGTTGRRVSNLLEAESGLSRGDFGVAFCPERTSSGRALKDIRGAYPKVVGGVDTESSRAAAVVYDEINSKGVLAVSDATTAEAVKVFEGVYRDVNIALANELARFADELEIDVLEAIEIANTQPFCEIHDPGPGVGGHCIPYYPYFLIEPFETPAPLLTTAREVNDSMPEFAVGKVHRGLEAEGIAIEDATVLVLGLTYRPGVEETRASPSIPISNRLAELGADVYGVDPLLDSVEEFAVESVALEGIYHLDLDAVVVVTPHEEFDGIRWSELVDDGGVAIVVDGRRSLESNEIPTRVYTIGRGIEERSPSE